MNLPQTKELCALESGNHAEDAFLFGKFQMILKADDVVAGLHQIFLPKLNDGVRHSACGRILQTDRTHRPKPQRVPAAPGELFDRETRFEIMCFFEGMNLDAL